MQPNKRTPKRRISINWVSSAIVGLGLMSAIGVASLPAHAAKRDSKSSDRSNLDCVEVARSQLLACQNSAQETYWLAVARCDNAAEEDPKSTCPKAAGADLRSERRDCLDQLASRAEICDQLGRGKYDPQLDPHQFSTSITNPYFPLKPGTKFVYEGDTAAGHEHDEFKVATNTRVIDGVTCVEVRDASWIDGVLSEDTLDWFAQDQAGNVWYFGEEAKQYEDGLLIGIDGSWRAGVDDAKPGIVMEASPATGDVYRQEYAISEAEDTAEVVGLGRTGAVPYASFDNALQTHEFSGLEPNASEQKYYVPGIGFVLSVDDENGERLELVSITP